VGIVFAAVQEKLEMPVWYRPTSSPAFEFKEGNSDSFTLLTRALRHTELTRDDIPLLRAMAVAASDHFFNEVADAIDVVGPITVWNG
jgi:hypothetical protein